MYIFAPEMKKAAGLLFIALYGIVLVRPAMPLIEYYFKVEEFKAKCINKTKPQLHCDGKCYLVKQLKAFHAEKTDSPSPVPAKINIEDYPIALVAKISSTLASIQIPTKLYPHQHVSITESHVSSIFHPPQAA